MSGACFMVMLCRHFFAGLLLLAHSIAMVQAQNVSVPTFNCAKATSVLARLICRSDEAAAADWELIAASWSYRYVLPAEIRERFDSEQHQWFLSLAQVCKLPQRADETVSKVQVSCVVDAYRKRAETHRASLKGDALAESKLPPDQLKQIQLSLVDAGLFSGTADGVFGNRTRAAITAFQSSKGFQTTGFLTTDQRRLLLGSSAEPVPSAQPAPASVAAVQSTPPQADTRPQVASASQGSEPQMRTESSPPGSPPEWGPPVVPQEQTRIPSVTAQAPQSNPPPPTRRSSSAATSPNNTQTKPSIRYEMATILSTPSRSQESLPRYYHDRAGSALFVVLLLAFGTAGFVLIRRHDRVRRASLFIIASLRSSFRSSPYRACAMLAAFAFAASIVAVLMFGNVRSVSAIPVVARHIPLQAQAYFVVPRIGEVLSALSKHASESAQAADPERLALATGQSAAPISNELNTFRALIPITMSDKRYLLPNGCLDFTDPADRRETGLFDGTSLGWFKARSLSNWHKLYDAVILGPVDLDRFSNYLANVNTRYVVAISITHPNRASRDIHISADTGLDTAQLCAFDGKRVRKLAEGTVLRIEGGSSHVLAMLEPSTAGTISPLNLQCTIQNKTSADETCRCYLYEFNPAEDKTTPLGECRRANLEKNAETGRQIRKFFRDPTKISEPLVVQLPHWGPESIGPTTVVRWHGSTHSLVVGPADILDDSSSGTDVAIHSSLVRDDAFVKTHGAVKKDTTAFLAAVRPDSFTHAVFNRLISLPVVISGSLRHDSISARARISFEPLDAAILQDISRPESIAHQSELPLSNNLGALSVRVGDGKIGDYIRFVDQYVLDRLIEGMATLDTVDADVGSRLAFARYLFRKIKKKTLADESEQSIAQKPHQIIVLENEPDAWSPSVAVAVKFANFDDAMSFICAEQQQITSEVHASIIINAAREAKSKVELNDDIDDYASALKGHMELALGENAWRRYAEEFDIDPVKVVVRRNVIQGPAQGCGAAKAKHRIGAIERDIYLLSPELFENSKRYYFRLPELERLKTRVRDETERDLQSKLRVAGEQLAAIRKVGAQVRVVMTKADNANPGAALSEAISEDVSVLNESLSSESILTVPDDLSNYGDLSKHLRLSAQDVERVAKEKSNDIAALPKELRLKQNEEMARIQRVADGIRRNEQRIVAYFDSNMHVLYIANNVSTLRRAVALVERTGNTKGTIEEQFAQRIRFYATGDGAIQWIADLAREWKRQWGEAATGYIDPQKWRDARARGTLLPWDRAVIGMTGERSGVTVSIDMTRRADSKQTP